MVFAKFSSLSPVGSLPQSRLRDTDTIRFDEDDVACLSLGVTLHDEDLDVWERDAFVNMAESRRRLICVSRNNSDPSSLCRMLWRRHSLGYDRNLRLSYVRS